MEEEIKETKTKKSHGVVWFIIFLILVIAGLVCYILIDDGVVEVPNISKTIEEKTKSSKKTGNTDKGIEMSVSNGNIVALFNMAHYIDYGTDQMVFNNKKLTVEDMDDVYRYRLAAQQLGNYHIDSIDSSIKYYTEAEVRAAYEKVFGPKTYKKVDKITTKCPIYKYNEDKKRYENSAGDGCGGAAGMWEIEDILSATKYSDRIEIISGVVYYRGNNGEDAFYKDYNRKTKLGDLITDSQSSLINDKLSEYLLSHRDDIEQYTYTFKLADDGFYYYTGVERTQE